MATVDTALTPPQIEEVFPGLTTTSGDTLIRRLVRLTDQADVPEHRSANAEERVAQMALRGLAKIPAIAKQVEAWQKEISELHPFTSSEFKEAVSISEKLGVSLQPLEKAQKARAVIFAKEITKMAPKLPAATVAENEALNQYNALIAENRTTLNRLSQKRAQELRSELRATVGLDDAQTAVHEIVRYVHNKVRDVSWYTPAAQAFWQEVKRTAAARDLVSETLEGFASEGISRWSDLGDRAVYMNFMAANDLPPVLWTVKQRELSRELIDETRDELKAADKSIPSIIASRLQMIMRSELPLVAHDYMAACKRDRLLKAALPEAIDAAAAGQSYSARDEARAEQRRKLEQLSRDGKELAAVAPPLTAKSATVAQEVAAERPEIGGIDA